MARSRKDRAPAELAPALGPVETLRWAWRQLTSMRTALLLLLLLAIAAVPGSVVPQRGVDARAVEAFQARHPDLSPWLERLGVFHTYTSPWFSAVYVLLMVSLIGCILPRTKVYLRSVRARPPRAPRNFDRLPASASRVDVVRDEAASSTGGGAGPGAAESAGGGAGRGAATSTGEVRAERGYLRELGNLVFHTSIVAVLVGVAAGALWGYRGAAIVTQGEGFANVLTQYDEFASGALFDTNDLPPFSLQLDKMVARFWTTGPQRGAPRLFEASGTYREGVDGREKPYEIRVNHPLNVGGTSVFLVGQGYAPVVKITDAKGDVVFDGAVPFLPADGTYTSNGVIKVPDARPEQLGFQGFFLPTAVSNGTEEASVSAFPGAVNPLLGLFVFHGDLGVDDGLPQSVYVLDQDKLEQYKNADGSNFRVSLSPGQEADLPDGGTIEFTDLTLFARFQIASTPLVWLPLGGISIGIVGLVLSLAVRPRRTWVRARRVGSRTVVEVAALDRVPRDDLGTSLEDLLAQLRSGLGDPPDDPEKEPR